jgi:UDP-N-acetylglucosamine 2-epimerase (non-hydrolysing)
MHSLIIKVLVVLGTRPEAIKMALVIKEIKNYPDKIECNVCVTAQHREMLDQVLRLFNIEPDYDLKIMENNQTPTQVASAVLARLEPILKEEKPDWVLVQGDTTTVAAASLAAFYARAKVGHVEAGLRTYDKWQPFPEEINRKIAGVIADLHFAPTERSCQNLLKEGVPRENIVITGNPVIDALYWAASMPLNAETLRLFELIGVNSSDKCNENDLQKSLNNSLKLILVTAHRRENFGQPLENICLALRDIAKKYSGKVKIFYPVHLNPNVWNPVHKLLGDVPDIILTPPIEYLPLVHIMKRSYLVLTDSGGIQEEAPAFGKPVLVLRNVTERPEAVEAGTVKVIGTDKEKMLQKVTDLLEDKGQYEKMSKAINPYGDGKASKRIAGALLNDLFDEWMYKANYDEKNVGCLE